MFNRDLLPNPQVYYGQQFTLKGNKTKYLVPCCFHHDKTASLSLDMVSGRFNCFGCGASGGDIVDFHQLKTGLSFVEAAKDLGAWVDFSTDTPDQLAARKAKIEQANKEYKVRQAQAAKAEKEHSQAFIPLVAAILKQCTKPMLETPYCAAKGITSHNLSSITATDLQRFTLPKDPSEPTAKAVTVCYGFEGVLTVAILETLDGESVALQVFDGVPNAKGKYARWIIGKPVVMGANYRLGDFTAPSVVLITEGIADAISCYEATGYPCLAAISKSQLANAAQAVKSKYPQALIVMCGDNDADGGGQQAAIAAAQAVNGLAVIPKGLDGVKDFNDLHQQHGIEAVKKMIDEAIEKKKAVPDATSTAPLNDDLARESIDDVGNGGDSESEDAAIERLSLLSAIEYERVRVDEAKKLNIRASVLDKLVAAKRKESQQTQDKQEAGTSTIFEEVSEWPHSVDGALLLQDITKIVQRFTVLSIEQARSCALWVAFTWFIDGAKVAPILNITSPEKRCGKSTLLLVIESMVFKPLLASNITGAALFRAVELWTPTLLIDETDAFLNEQEEMRGILNAGHYRRTAFVIRTTGDNHEPKKFMTWCAKVLCGIGKIANTLIDRSIVIELRRKLASEQVENINLANEDEFSVICQKLKRWSQDHFEQYREQRPKRIEGINDRAADNWQPLQSVAGLAGKEWPNLCRLAAIQLSGIEEETPSINVELLMDIADIFHDRGMTKIFTADLIEALCQDEEKAWATWNRGKPITAHQVSKKLSEFKIKPDDVRIGTIHKKGYKLQDINEALIRYKPTPDENATPRQASNTNAYSDLEKRDNDKMSRTQKPLEPLINKDCRGVADKSDMAHQQTIIDDVEVF